MCGIFGTISSKNLENREILKLKKLMDPRGPDSKGIYKDEFQQKKLCFIFSRLSIIALGKESNQPFEKFNKIIMFNGEIYNYLEMRRELESKYNFNTNSDTEVLITAYHEYGTDFLKKIEGMFSIVILDKKNDYIFFCRDRFGEKPLYYFKNNKKLIFGSEIKYIKTQLTNLTINEKKISNFLIKGYRSVMNNNETIYNEIKSFPKGEFWIYKDGHFRSKNKYWSLKYQPNKKLTTKTATEIAENKLVESIKLRLRADVNIAHSLSGGIDSGLVAGIVAKKFNKKLDCFSVIDSDTRYNEKENIDLIKKKYDFKNSNEIYLDKKNFINNLTLQINSHQSPILTVTSYICNILAKQVGRSKNKVIFSGVGSDELFSGYYDYGQRWLYEMKGKKNFKIKLKEWRLGQGKYIENPLLINNLKQNIKPSNKNLFHGEDIFKKLMNKNYNKTSYRSFKFSHSNLRNQMLNDLFNENVPVVLNQDDLNYMNSSVENRCPFLDKNLVEFAYTIPNELLIQKGMSKYILRNIGKKYLPKDVNFDKRKKGFNASINSLFDLKNKSNINFLLDDSKIFEYVNKKKFEIFIKNNNFSMSSYSKFLFSFINMKIFLENSK